MDQSQCSADNIDKRPVRNLSELKLHIDTMHSRHIAHSRGIPSRKPVQICMYGSFNYVIVFAFRYYLRFWWRLSHHIFAGR